MFRVEGFRGLGARVCFEAHMKDTLFPETLSKVALQIVRNPNPPGTYYIGP